jgi:hypothetical protein
MATNKRKLPSSVSSIFRKFIYIYIHIPYIHINTYIYVCIYGKQKLKTYSLYTYIYIYSIYIYIHIYIYVSTENGNFHLLLQTENGKGKPPFVCYKRKRRTEVSFPWSANDNGNRRLRGQPTCQSMNYCVKICSNPMECAIPNPQHEINAIVTRNSSSAIFWTETPLYVV